MSSDAMWEALPRGSTAPARLARLGFADPRRAHGVLTGLGLWRGDRAADDGAELVVWSVATAADPDLALLSLDRVVGADRPAGADLLSALRRHAGLRSRLLAVLGASAALGDHLAAHPGDWSLLADDATALSRPSAYGLRRTLLAAPDPGALRDAYRRQLLTLAARDLVNPGGEPAGAAGGQPVDDTAAELADLAAAGLAAALALASAQLPADAPPCRLAVVAMGKCGGRELNYVSDVDVVFVAEPDGPALRTATLLAEGMIRVAAEALFQVDAALRPEGKAGPLVRSLASHATYYGRWAKTWEFQALLKARPVAGDVALGQRYVETLAPLVWTAAGRDRFVEDVQAMRRRVEASLPSAQAGRELKLGPGGLRDVEFAVQLLQLVHGRTDPALRLSATLPALEALAAGGYVGVDDADSLAAAYRFLRRSEHLLQLARLRRTHLVPTDPAARTALARAMGYRDGVAGPAADAWTRDWQGHARQVRRLHERLFYRPLLRAVARLPADAQRLTPEAAAERLTALGFADPRGALRHLEALTGGLSRRAAVLRTVLPVMLGDFAAAADPDAGLLAFRSVADALGDAPELLTLLRDSPAGAQRLARVLATSRYVADLLSRAPDAVSMLADDQALAPRDRSAVTAELGAAACRTDAPERAVAAVRALRRVELLRVACADLLGVADAPAVARGLADSTAATLTAALDVAVRSVEHGYGEPLPVTVAVIAMGRLGGGEPGYGSDADVLFVHEPAPGADEAQAAGLAHAVAETLRRLLALPGPDPAVAVDVGLRPEGRQGPLTRSLAGYARYHAGRASVWEAQALLRAAPLAGDRDLTARFLALVDPVRYPAGGLPQAAVREVRRVKGRVEVERLPRGVDRTRHLKLGPGMLADIEWTVQLLQLRHAGAVPSLRVTGTLPALAAARETGLLGVDDEAVLRAAWTAASRTRDALVLVRGRATEVLPTDARTLAAVARVLGYPPGAPEAFTDDLRRLTRRARAVVERVFSA